MGEQEDQQAKQGRNVDPLAAMADGQDLWSDSKDKPATPQSVQPIDLPAAAAAASTRMKVRFCTYDQPTSIKANFPNMHGVLLIAHDGLVVAADSGAAKLEGLMFGSVVGYMTARGIHKGLDNILVDTSQGTATRGTGICSHILQIAPPEGKWLSVSPKSRRDRDVLIEVLQARYGSHYSVAQIGAGTGMVLLALIGIVAVFILFWVLISL